jgi:pimeloyl-ACP methyl ester carboxylesterase
MMFVYETAQWSTVGILDLSSDDERGSTLVVTLHPQGSSKSGYRNTFTKFSRVAFKRGFSVLRFDYPNEGESKLNSVKLNDLSAIRDLLVHVKKTYNFKKIVLLGHCSGGYYGIELILKFPGLIDGIIFWHIAPVIHDITKPKFESTILPALRETPRTIIRVVRLCSRSLYHCVVYPFALLRFVVNMRIKTTAFRAVKQLYSPKLLVVINPDRSYYKHTDEGILLTRNSLKAVGFDNIDFITIENKIFSIEWQKFAFTEVVDHLEKVFVNNKDVLLNRVEALP